MTPAYAWSPAPGLTPLAWSVGYLHPNDPGAAGRELAARLKPLPPGRRAALLFRHDAADAGQTPALRVADGPRWDALYYRALFAAVRAAGADVDRLVFDDEAGVSTWHLGDAGVAAVLTDPPAARQLPPAARARDRAGVVAWNQWAAERRATGLREGVVVPAERILGHAIPATNYGDLRTGWGVADPNGWPWPAAAVGAESSPPLYLAGPDRWASFTRAINVLRSASARGDVIPWVSYPGYAGDGAPEEDDYWLWEQLVRHCAAAGVREFLLWNPAEGRDPERVRRGDAFAAGVFAGLVPGARRRSAPLAGDAGTARVVTGGVVTVRPAPLSP